MINDKVLEMMMIQSCFTIPYQIQSDRPAIKMPTIKKEMSPCFFSL